MLVGTSERFARVCAACRLCLVWLALACLLVAPAPSAAQSPAVDAAAVEALKKKLDAIDAAASREGASAESLAAQRDALNAARDELWSKIGEVEPRAGEADERLKQLGPAPAANAPPEAASVAEERANLTRAFSELDGALKQLRSLVVRADQLSERITDRRHTLYARQLFARSPSVFDPFFWQDVARALPGEARSVWLLLKSWGDSVASGDGWIRMAAAVPILLLILALAVFITQRWLPRFDAGPRADTRFARARTGLAVFIWLAARTPLVALCWLLVLDGFALLPYRIEEIGYGLVVAIVIASFGRGVARGMLAPDKPERRLIAIDDRTAGCFHDHLVWSTRALGATILLQVVHKILYAPLVLTVATNVLLAAVISGLLVHLVLSLHRAEDQAGTQQADDGAVVRAPWIRAVAWLVIAVMSVALIAGYAGFAAFVALRAVVAGAVFASLYLLLVIADAMFTETIKEDSRRGRALAGNLGIAPRNLELVGTLISAGVRVLLILLALLLIVGPWEASTAGLFESLRNVPLGFRVGELTISFRSVLGALTVLILVLVVTRIVQRWMRTQFLPRTSLEPSLQLSIAMIFGYIGVITAIALALGGLGIDLQKIAFVAGALSVGIGFGLQAIVSNFVSGLILLAERPIRVGDAIAVKGEEGWVRRIRVRATEIETYDRASVIIPNSDLITGVVKNWTHLNTMGRITIKVVTTHDADPEVVRDILMTAADAHAQVLRSPPPRAFLTTFTDSGLEFELRCVVSNVENGLSVKSDLHFAVVSAFRAMNIVTPFQRDFEVKLMMVPKGDGPEKRREGDAPSRLPAEKA